MKKLNIIILALCCLLLCPLIASADTDIYHEPAEDQLRKEQALQLAADFWLKTCGVDLSEEYGKDSCTALFGPGYQWQVDTEEDCWRISIPFDTEAPIHPFITLHGTSGEALYWSFRDKEARISYVCAVPDENMITAEEAIAIVRAQYAADAELDEAAAQGTRCSVSFGICGRMMSVENEAHRELPVWDIVIGGGEEPLPLMGGYVVSALDGEIISKTLQPDPEYGR